MTHVRGSEALALALARGLTVTKAAEEAGVSRATATRRLADLDFRKQVQTFRAELVDRAAGQLADAATEAAETLRGLLKSESESIRLRLAVSLLEEAVRYRDSEDVANRVAILEAWATELTDVEKDAEKYGFGPKS